jgi:hypothetical protein
MKNFSKFKFFPSLFFCTLIVIFSSFDVQNFTSPTEEALSISLAKDNFIKRGDKVDFNCKHLTLRELQKIQNAANHDKEDIILSLGFRLLNKSEAGGKIKKAYEKCSQQDIIIWGMGDPGITYAVEDTDYYLEIKKVVKENCTLTKDTGEITEYKCKKYSYGFITRIVSGKANYLISISNNK